MNYVINRDGQERQLTELLAEKEKEINGMNMVRPRQGGRSNLMNTQLKQETREMNEMDNRDSQRPRTMQGPEQI